MAPLTPLRSSPSTCATNPSPPEVAARRADGGVLWRGLGEAVLYAAALTAAAFALLAVHP